MSELARFLFQRGHYSRDNNAVRPSAFLPKNGETSVFEILGLEDLDIWKLAEDVGEIRGKPPRGRGEFTRADVGAVGLRFVRDDHPVRHGNLLGWPSEGSELKARLKAIAVALASRAVLVLH